MSRHKVFQRYSFFKLSHAAEARLASTKKIKVFLPQTQPPFASMGIEPGASQLWINDQTLNQKRQLIFDCVTKRDN